MKKNGLKIIHTYLKAEDGPNFYQMKKQMSFLLFKKNRHVKFNSHNKVTAYLLPLIIHGWLEIITVCYFENL